MSCLSSDGIFSRSETACSRVIINKEEDEKKMVGFARGATSTAETILDSGDSAADCIWDTIRAEAKSEVPFFFLALFHMISIPILL